MWDSRENSFTKTGRTRWSYETCSSARENQTQNRDTFARMRPSHVSVQEDSASQQRVNVQQRSSYLYRQQRSSWQQDNHSWYTMRVNFLLSSVLRLLASRYRNIHKVVSHLFLHKWLIRLSKVSISVVTNVGFHMLLIQVDTSVTLFLLCTHSISRKIERCY